MKVIITIEDITDTNITLTTQISEGTANVTNSTAVWMAIKLITQATVLLRERKKSMIVPPQLSPLVVSL